MRPGKIFRPISQSIPLYPAACVETKKRKWVFCNQTFFVIAVELDKEVTRAARFHDLSSPWLVLFNGKKWLAETYNRKLMDLTPWPPWHSNSKHNKELIKDYKHYVKQGS